ncbi:MAG TPA: DMT family transporter [Ktedonobacterales bacterium]|jgi:drug/metabolite transporter (DMT)-like permease
MTIKPAATTQTTAPPSSTRVWTARAILGFALITLIWGSFSVAAKVGVQSVPPLLLGGLRFTLAGAILFGVSLARHEKILLPRTQLLRVVLLSFLTVSLSNAAFFWAIQYAPAGTLTTIWATAPIFTTLFNSGASNEARGWRLILSLAIGLGGVGLVFLDKLGVGSGLAIAADSAVLVSAAVYGLGMRVAKNALGALPVLQLSAWQLLLGGLIIATASVLFERGQPVDWTPLSVGILFYMILITGSLASVLTFWLIKRIGTIRTTYNSFLVPGLALFLGHLLLGEPITLPKVAGMVLVIGGLALVGRS